MRLSLQLITGKLITGTLGLLFMGMSLQAGEVSGWLNWRGPHQNGTSKETGLPGKIEVGGEKHLWTKELPGRSTAAIANGRMYIMAFERGKPHLREKLVCMNAETGKTLWEYEYNDFISDIIYDRYATSSPTIDPETGNIYVQGCNALLMCFSPDGELLWKHSLMEEYGMMTFPNGRSPSPQVDKDLVITHGIVANWGKLGPGRDRFFAFDKKTGELVWISTPGGGPQDSSFSTPVFQTHGNKRVFYCGTGDGRVVSVNARNGKPLWSIPFSEGGVNSSVLLHQGKRLVAIHSFQNIDTGTSGRMAGFDIIDRPSSPRDGAPPHDLRPKDVELWRQPISCFTSSPTTHGDVVYQVSIGGELFAINAKTGETYWRKKLGIEQQYSSPAFADGKLYVGILEDLAEEGDEGIPTAGSGQTGGFYVIKPSSDQRDYKVLSHLELDGRVFGSPVPYNGKVYIQTTQKLYCFGEQGDNPGLPEDQAEEPRWPETREAHALQVVPYDVALRPGEEMSFSARVVDKNGFVVRKIDDLSDAEWERHGKVNASFNDAGNLKAAPKKVPSAGTFTAKLGDLEGKLRVRVLPAYGYDIDFESFQLTEDHPVLDEKFAWPPTPWLGARLKFEVRELNDNKVLGKTIRIKLFQRAEVFMGHPDMKNYTMTADVMSEGNRRKMGEVGLLNQRYYIVLRGQSRLIEINCNPGKFKATERFRMKPNVWYQLKSRVDLQDDGSAVIRGKAWPRSEPEPEEWTIEATHRYGNTHGTPGLYGFSPQDMRVYVDNIKVEKSN